MEINNIFDPILEILIGLVVTYIFRLVKLKLKVDNMENILKWINIAVRAIEGEIRKPKAGLEKKENVTEFITNKFGDRISKEELSKAIDASVFDMNKENTKKEKELILINEGEHLNKIN